MFEHCNIYWVKVRFLKTIQLYNVIILLSILPRYHVKCWNCNVSFILLQLRVGWVEGLNMTPWLLFGTFGATWAKSQCLNVSFLAYHVALDQPHIG